MLLFINVFDKLSFYSRETLALPPMPFKKCKQHFKRIVELKITSGVFKNNQNYSIIELLRKASS